MRTGRIACLPQPIREQLNRRLESSEDYEPILNWLNALPEAKQVIDDHFAGRSIFLWKPSRKSKKNSTSCKTMDCGLASGRQAQSSLVKPGKAKKIFCGPNYAAVPLRCDENSVNLCPATNLIPLQPCKFCFGPLNHNLNPNIISVYDLVTLQLLQPL